jgi:glycosyltransferase 2 family protein
MSGNLYPMKTVAKIAISLFLTGAFLWIAFQNVDWPSLIVTFRNTAPGGIVAATILTIVSCLPRAWRWRILLSSVSKDIPLSAAFKAVLIAYAGNNLFPRAGEFARVVALTRDHPMPVGSVVASVIVERLLDMLTLLVFFAIVLVYARGKIARAFPGLESVGLVTLIGILIAFAGILVISMFGNRGIDALQRQLSRISEPMAQKISSLLHSFLQGMSGVRTLRGYVGILVSTLLTNLCYVLSIYFPFYSFGFIENFNLTVFDALVVMVLASVGVVIPTPGGTGTYHFFCSQTLHLFYAIPEVQALAFATVVHGAAFLAFCLFGGPPLFRLLWTQKKEAQNT